MWPTLIPIIARYGVEFAYKLWDIAKTKTDPTQADWDELLKLSQKSYDDYVNEALARRGGPTFNPQP